MAIEKKHNALQSVFSSSELRAISGSLRRHSFGLIQILSVAFAVVGAFPLSGASEPTANIAMSDKVLRRNVKRLGVNLGTLTFYDSGQTTKNLINRNPGFEAQIWNSTVRCSTGTTTTCVDDDQWSGWPAGFWKGASFEVFYGAAAGRKGTVESSTAPAKGQGVTLKFSSPGRAPGPGDYLILRKTIPGGATGGWWPSTNGAGKVIDNLDDLPADTLGKQTAALIAPTSSDTAALASYFDTTPGRAFVQLNGTYELTFKARGTGGTKQAHLSVVRSGSSAYLDQIVDLSDKWNSYSLKFTAEENGSAVGSVRLTFATQGADAFELDDVSLSKIGGDPSNLTSFRDPVVAALRMLQPGILRLWGGNGYLGETLDNLLTPDFGRQRAEYSAWSTSADQISYGLHDFLVLCHAVGAEPWLVVPSTFSESDAANFIEYLAGDGEKPYGKRRVTLGQVSPWTQVFKTIHVEFGNEAWNSGFKGGNIEYPEPYGLRAQAIFGIMKANAAYDPVKFDLVLGGQAASPGRNAGIQSHCNNNDSFAIAPYTMGTIDNYSDKEVLYGSTFAEPEALTSENGAAEGLAPGMIYQNDQVIRSASRKVPISFYEVNLSTLAGSIPQSVLDSYTPSLGAGLMVIDTMLMSLKKFGVINQALFALTQYEFARPDHKRALLWGAAVDFGVTDRRRPQFLALQLANQAIENGADLLETAISGSALVWNQPLANTVKFNAAHYLQSFSFAKGTDRSLVVLNLSRDSARSVTFSESNAPRGSVDVQQLASDDPSDTNEDRNLIQIKSSTLNDFSASSSLSLPPNSMTVLRWSTGSDKKQ